MHTKRPIATMLRGIGVTGATVTLSHYVPKQGEKIVYTHVAFENEDTATSDVELYIDTPDGVIGIDKFDNLAADDIVPYVGEPIVINHPNKLRVDWLSTVNLDVLWVYLIGYVEFDEPDLQ